MKAERLNLRVEDNPSDVDLAANLLIVAEDAGAMPALVLQALMLPRVPAMYRATEVLLGISELPSPTARAEP